MQRPGAARQISSAPDPRYPIGRFCPAIEPETPDDVTRALLTVARDGIATCPSALAAALAGLSEQQLQTPYRPGGWTLQQLAHHVADSHTNAYVRLRLALTEDWPTIKPYDEALWADLPDVKLLPVDVSLSLLAALHTRWVTLLAHLGGTDWKRGYLHPADGPVTLARMTELYCWHGRHHIAHILALRAARGW